MHSQTFRSKHLKDFDVYFLIAAQAGISLHLRALSPITIRSLARKKAAADLATFLRQLH